MTMTTIVVAGILSALSTNLANDLVTQGVAEKAQGTLVQKADLLANPVKFKVDAKIEAEISDGLQTLGDSSLGIVVVDVNGALLNNSDATPELLAELQAIALQSIGSAQAEASQSNRILARPIVAGSSESVIGAVALAWTPEPAKAAIIGQKIKIAGWAAGVFVVMSILTIYLLRRSLGLPMARLSGAIARVSDGDYETPIGMVNRRDELGDVARKLAHLMEKLQIARESEVEKERQNEAQVAVVEQLGKGLMQLADGVLHKEITEEFPESYKLLQQNYNRALRGLHSAITRVSENSGNIRHHADEIAQASTDLSQRTETQAATLEQSAAALDQMLAMVKDAATAAEEAENAVQNTTNLASRSGDVMRSAMSAMGEIEKSSEQINDIISVIDDIAFQTNLLALNAGVEAARAGESGKGFAVVASEVQGLAQRSAEAAQQIKELIVGSADQVQDGVMLVQSAGSALDEVLSNVSGISTMVGGIAKRASDQADGLNEINIGVMNLDRVTQQNAAMVEESASAAQMLRNEAMGLSDLVQTFTLDDGAVDEHEDPAQAA
ncbi:methyl-accepting chemotaxis protein [Pelagimonas varians]|nr:methyl-accepting chemotaxis protein [Pelagimonas varians]